MKRHLFQLLAGVTVMLSTVVFLSSGNNKTLSDLALANIEAIASGEPDDKVGCCSSIKFQPGGLVVYCADCTIWKDYIDGTSGTGSGMCTIN